MEIELVFYETTTQKEYSLLVTESDMNYSYDSNINIGKGCFTFYVCRENINPSNLNCNNIQFLCSRTETPVNLSVTLTVVPRMLTQDHVRVLYYVLLSVGTDISGNNVSVTLTSCNLIHDRKFYNIGKISLFSSYPIVLQSKQFISSVVEVNYRYKDFVILPS